MKDANASPICHIVMWDVTGSNDAEKRDAINAVRDAFEALRDRIPGMTRLEIGVDISRIDYACDMLLLTEFESEAALAAYAVHPEHLAVRDRLAGLRIARHQVDYQIATGSVS
ncbi:Dabb family protein [Pseudotabrizicola alkalilacus]|uniref:Dabb family protein n=1 Tax=Pseudotabrizicola alkalilacus TaxID=2305252 RepID=A0A411Z327_9RHOB|nr:Dabb family protein [Pseudotabrizicola alkalilacus]RGP37432.1 Dabb family protein [Pseudotabrizicola alkalilacus]